MEFNVVSASNPKDQGQFLGGEYPIEELHTGEGGLLKVSMDGVRLLFPQRKVIFLLIPQKFIKRLILSFF